MAEEEKKEKNNVKQEASAGAPAPIKEEKNDEENVESVKERLLRLAAEFDNYKKRVAKDIEASKSIGQAEAVAKILPSLDEMELAIAALSKENGEKGIMLVYSNLMSTLKGLGLKEIDTKGAFDPYKHEIMLSQASKEKEGTILEVVRKGYMLNGIMLRPASVVVSRGEENVEKKKEEVDKNE